MNNVNRLALIGMAVIAGVLVLNVMPEILASVPGSSYAGWKYGNSSSYNLQGVYGTIIFTPPSTIPYYSHLAAWVDVLFSGNLYELQTGAAIVAQDIGNCGNSNSAIVAYVEESLPAYYKCIKVAYPTSGSTHNYKLVNVGYVGGGYWRWNFYFDGSLVAYTTDVPYGTGRPYAMSEYYTPSYTAVFYTADFNNLQYTLNSSNWYLWNAHESRCDYPYGVIVYSASHFLAKQTSSCG